MKVEQIYDSGLKAASYLIIDGADAAVIDPFRDIQPYLEFIKKHKAGLKFIFMTHVPDDFVSGQLELVAQTGAQLVYPPFTSLRLKFHKAIDGEIFKLGQSEIKVISTPGHTVASGCYLLTSSQASQPAQLFSGDTILHGGVGQIDLQNEQVSGEDLAEKMFQAIEHLKKLPDDTVVYPAHGILSEEEQKKGTHLSTTIEKEKENNFAFTIPTLTDFKKRILSIKNEPTEYNSRILEINSKSHQPIQEIKEQALKPLSVSDIKDAIARHDWILDTREPEVFTQGFIPHSININLGNSFSQWAERLIPYDKNVVLICTPGKEEETIMELATVGIDKISGYLEGGWPAWLQSGEQEDMIIDVSAEELGMDLPYDRKLAVIDVRNKIEFEAGHVKGAALMPLESLKDTLTIAKMDTTKNMYIHCSNGSRSVTACSLLKREGFNNLRNVTGGWDNIEKEPSIPLSYPKTE